MTVLVALAGLSRPPARPPDSTRDIRLGISNARQVVLALAAFEKKYGRYPDEETAVRVQEEAGESPGSAGHSSNSIFRQLFAAGVTEDEKMFYAKISGSRIPDGAISGERLLEKGECAFSYLAGATKGDPPGRPILAAPMIPGTDRFDPKPFRGRAIIATVGGSVRSVTINKDGHAMQRGENLLDPQRSIWSTRPPVVKWHE
ncbi:MAG: hypothetical protein EOP85_09160 [Verrucomicrobiaceae bacterium]|nr:MAG: hypothetical protein EOP85_09160 [Verrucomicrobiaceae bacterium]